MMLDLTEEESDALAKLLSAIAPHSELKGHFSEDPTGAGSRALAAAEGLRASVERQIPATTVKSEPGAL
jgi:hypothetical protein